MAISMFDLERSISDLEDKNSKIPLSVSFAYGPKEHSCTFITLSYQNCRRSLRKRVKIGEKRQWPLWPWLWPCDLEVMGVCWPCPYLPSIWIWWWSEVIKVTKCPFQCLTPYIWPWGSKLKIPPHEISSYWPKEHSCVFIWLFYQNCRRR